MAARLTAKSIEQVKPAAHRREIPDAALQGLYLIVQPSGAKSWAVRYRASGRPRKHTLGPYPRLELGAAREAARAAFQAIGRGKDPALDKREMRRREQAGVADRNTFEKAWEDYEARHVDRNMRASSAREVKGIFKREFLPRWRKRLLSEVAKRDVQDMLDDLLDRGVLLTANRAFSVARKFFNWCVERDLLPASPCAGIKRPHAEKSRDRVLSDDEIRFVWRAATKDGEPFGTIIRLLLLTAARREEVRGMADTEIDKAARGWTIPAARTKNGRAHDVPLSDAALALIGGATRVKNKRQFVFCINGENPVSGFSRAKARIDRRMLRTARALARLRGDDPAKVTIAPWRVHDLRRTVASGMARLGIALPVIERCLNHVSGSFGGIVGVYQRHEFADEKRAAFDTWARHLAQILARPHVAAPREPLRAVA